MATRKKARATSDAPAAPLVPASMLSFHLKRAEQALSARKFVGIKELDLTYPQCTALGFLTGGVAKSCTQLAREALVTSQTMTGIMKNLEIKGLVERHASPDHGRVMLFSLTPAGAERAAAARAYAEGVEHGLCEAMSQEDYAQLAKLLDRVAELAPDVTIGTGE